MIMMIGMRMMLMLMRMMRMMALMMVLTVNLNQSGLQRPCIFNFLTPSSFIFKHHLFYLPSPHSQKKFNEIFFLWADRQKIS